MLFSAPISVFIRALGRVTDGIPWSPLELDAGHGGWSRFWPPLFGITWSHEGSLILMCGAGLLLIGVIWWFASTSDHW